MSESVLQCQGNSLVHLSVTAEHHLNEDLYHIIKESFHARHSSSPYKIPDRQTDRRYKFNMPLGTLKINF